MFGREIIWPVTPANLSIIFHLCRYISALAFNQFWFLNTNFSQRWSKFSQQNLMNQNYLITSNKPSAMMNISRATSPFLQIRSPGVKMNARIFSTKS